VAIAYQHVRENPIPPSRVDPEIPSWADSIVLKAMAKDPGDRYQSAGEMRNDIQRALQGMPVAAPTRLDAYQGTRRMGSATQMAGATSAIPPYDYGPPDEPPGRGGRKKWPWIVAALAAILLIVGLVYAFNYVSGSGSSYAVPDVVGLPVATAEKEIANAHLVSSVKMEASSTVPKGNVISTSPANGTNVQKGSTVKLLVSSGAKKVKVPRVVGSSESQAQTVLEGAGFTVSVKQLPNSSAPLNQVVRQSPTGGTLEPAGSQVTIYVSGGGKQVPDVLSLSQQQATTTLESDGFNVDPIVQSGQGATGFQPGQVWKQSPQSGSVLAQGSTVAIYIVPQITSQPSPSNSPSPSPSNSPSPSPNPTSS
jgi:eukaryotic-like serine/threonine-protein kinase